MRGAKVVGVSYKRNELRAARRGKVLRAEKLFGMGPKKVKGEKEMRARSQSHRRVCFAK
jgi:hypothetical protein